MPTLMVGTDFSTRSDRALRRAVLIARQTGWDLIVVSVVDDDQPRRMLEAARREASAILAELEQTLADEDGIACRSELRTGEPFIELPAAADAAGAALMVLGPHRRQFLKDQFRGTTVERTLRRIAIPTIVANGVPSGRYRRVLTAVDLEPESDVAPRYVASSPVANEAEHILLHVYDPAASSMLARAMAPEDERVAYERETADAARAGLLRLIDRFGLTGVTPVVRPCVSLASAQIAEAAEEFDADLIGLRSSDKGNLAKAFLGSTVEALLRDASRDVLVVPGSSEKGPRS
jgi:nucleotide-binding universal stress UspA family protein